MSYSLSIKFAKTNKELEAVANLRYNVFSHEFKSKGKTFNSEKKIEWGAQIRSYVLDDRRVKDHRTNHQTSNTEAVLNGEIDAFLKSYLMEFS